MSARRAEFDWLAPSEDLHARIRDLQHQLMLAKANEGERLLLRERLVQLETIVARVVELEAEVAQLSAERAALQSTVEQMRTSTSWKVTAPIRAATNRLSRWVRN